MKNRKLNEERVERRLIFSGNAVKFRADIVRLQDGKLATREFMDHPGAVAILPVLSGGDIVMVRQYRYPVGNITLELPAGKLHSKKDDPLNRAAAELKEETGYTAGVLKHLISFWPTAAFANEILHIYTAYELKAGTSCPDEDEFLKVERVPLTKALRLVNLGKIKDAKTIIGLQAYALARGKHKGK